MKKHIPSALFVLLCTSLTATAQEIMVFEMKDSTAHEFNVEDIRRIIFRSKEELPNDSIVYLSCPDDHHPHLIDLGLPSGTKWACCNVGAYKPEGSGGYYAWGEVEEKDDYEWETYQFVDYDTEECEYIADDISGSEYDVAHVLWGGAWRMPSSARFTELLEQCTVEWTRLNDVEGCLLTGPNGGTLFFPLAGGFLYNWLYYEGLDGYYWTSSFDAEKNDSAHFFYFRAVGWFEEISQRYLGYTVRAVCP